MDNEHAAIFAREFAGMNGSISRSVVGKPLPVGLVLTALFAGGHVLLEDVPGTGKTSLAKAVAACLRGTHKRIQFTPDLLPSDVTGANIYNQKTGEFEYREGPVFCSVLLADEINRASPKTQSALLEVMEERHVTVEGIQRPVPEPFVVIATQNSVEQLGTYPLPEAQLDRFLIRTELGYVDHASAVGLVVESALKDRTAGVRPTITAERIVELGNWASGALIAPAIADYIVSVVEATRVDPRCRADAGGLGASMRGALALARCTKVYAMSQARPYVIPDDVKALARAVLAHRLILTPDAVIDGVKQNDIVDDILRAVPVPRMADSDIRQPTH